MTIAAGSKVRASDVLTIQTSLLAVVPQTIGSQSVTSGTSSALTVSLTGTWSSLLVHWTGRTNNASAASGVNLTFNGDGLSHYLWLQSEANNSTLTTTPAGGLQAAIHIGTEPGASATDANFFGHGTFTVAAPGGSTYKVAVGHATGYTTNTDVRLGLYGGEWQSTAGITSLSLAPASGAWVVGSKVTVIGIP